MSETVAPSEVGLYAELSTLARLTPEVAQGGSPRALALAEILIEQLRPEVELSAISVRRYSRPPTTS